MDYDYIQHCVSIHVVISVINNLLLLLLLFSFITAVGG